MFAFILSLKFSSFISFLWYYSIILVSYVTNIILAKFSLTNQLSDIERNVPKAYQLICEARERIIFKTLASILAEGKKSGIFRKDLKVDFAVKILIGTAEYMTSPKVLDSLEFANFTEVMKEIFNTFLQGCYSEEGRQKSKKF